MREVLCIDRESKDGKRRQPELVQIDSRLAYLTEKIFKIAYVCLFFTDLMRIRRIRAITKGVLKEKWDREVSLLRFIFHQ